VGKRQGQRQGQRSQRFTHVRFNRMHALLTYEGPPLSVRDLKLVRSRRATAGRGLHAWSDFA
jgi:hypothetical protein